MAFLTDCLLSLVPFVPHIYVAGSGVPQDDLKLYLSIDSERSCELLQEDLNALHAWSLTNRLLLNVSKFQWFLNWVRSNPRGSAEVKTHTRLMIRVPIKKGSSDLRFSNHIDSVFCPTLRMPGFVFSNSRHFHNPTVLRLLYNALVRSIMEYASMIWSPSAKIQSIKLELIQIWFLRILCKQQYGNYPYLFPLRFVMGMVGYKGGVLP
ncbi:uncharacterized protein LOC143919227 [Arctopsyche grandis]|uniref:uncharacterized protein LOC143919227 n=1 Tax=Arctopsyche grandis TaxID=121162 RepID=UPI00406D81CF